MAVSASCATTPPRSAGRDARLYNKDFISVNGLCCSVVIGKMGGTSTCFFSFCVIKCYSLICLTVSVDDSISVGMKCLVGFDRALVLLIVRHYLRSLDSECF